MQNSVAKVARQLGFVHLKGMMFPEHFNVSWLFFSFSRFGHQQNFSYYEVLYRDTSQHTLHITETRNAN